MFIIAFVAVKSDRNFMKPVPAAWCKKNRVSLRVTHKDIRSVTTYDELFSATHLTTTADKYK